MSDDNVVPLPSSESRVDTQLEQARTLAQALPYMRKYSDARFVIKYGGAAMGDSELSQSFARDVVLMKQVGINPIVVHGGGPQIGKMLERLKIDTSFVDGLRVTDRETVDVVEMVLAGSINKGIVAAIQEAGGQAVGISGKDGNLVRARKLRRTRRDPDSNIEKILDLGFVGEPSEVIPDLLDSLEETNFIPVIAPIAADKRGQTYNINADSMAGAIAGVTEALRLFLLTDVPGVLDKDGKLIPELTVSQARELIADGVIVGGMIPKVETCIAAVEDGVEAAVIQDGRRAHALLVEVYTEGGAGTLIHDD
ncbi:MAG: acetylglutamate kinase [Pseudomonadota bacterium]